MKTGHYSCCFACCPPQQVRETMMMNILELRGIVFYREYFFRLHAKTWENENTLAGVEREQVAFVSYFTELCIKLKSNKPTQGIRTLKEGSVDKMAGPQQCACANLELRVGIKFSFFNFVLSIWTGMRFESPGRPYTWSVSGRAMDHANKQKQHTR